MKDWFFSFKKLVDILGSRCFKVSKSMLRYVIIPLGVATVFLSVFLFDYTFLCKDPTSDFLVSQEQIIRNQNIVALLTLSTPTAMGGLTPDDIFTRLEYNDNYVTLMREMQDQSSALSVSPKDQEAIYNSLIQHLQDRRAQIAAIPSIRPLEGGRLTSPFGYRKSPFGSKMVMHTGIDISAPMGAPVLATAAGTVVSSKYQGYYGLIVAIDHGQGLVTRYAHLSRAMVNQGAYVSRGQLIGHVGRTGRATGTHLHYEVILNGTFVNPEKYIFN